MGIRDAIRNAVGGGTPARLPAQATTQQIEKFQKARAKEKAASVERSRRHKFLVSRGESEPLEPLD